MADDCLWIDDAILQSTSEENETYERENLILTINEGVKV